MNNDEKYMNRCLQLAKNGLGTTYPNPLVGSVIVYKDKIIGEGWHKKAGLPHAEVNAINSVRDKSLLPESTIYVNLEPCSHFGKTPPCCDLIAAHQIQRVVVGTIDPNTKVAGQGIDKLREAGCDVSIGVLEKDCLELNRRFFTFQNKKRPYIILKWAESSDGFIAPSDNEGRNPVWITNQFSRQLVHKWRTEEQAILVGTTTVISDNPQLTARDWKGANPRRIVIDQARKIPEQSHIFDNQALTIIISGGKSFRKEENVIFEMANSQNGLPNGILETLFSHDIQSVIIEGGRFTLQSFIDAGLWDEARIFKGQSFLVSGIRSPEIKCKNTIRNTIAGDELIIFRND